MGNFNSSSDSAVIDQETECLVESFDDSESAIVKGDKEPFANPQSKLFKAVKAGDLEQIKTLLLWDAQCVQTIRDKRKNTALHLAAACGRSREFELLHLHASDLLAAVNEVNNTAAHRAAEGGHVTILRYIAEKEPELILRKGAMGATPGHLAAIHGHLDAIRFLAHISPSSLSARDRNGSTLVHYAAQHGHTAVVAFAHSQRAGALLDMNNAFHTPVHLAASAGSGRTLEFGAAFGRCVHEPGCDPSEEVRTRAAGGRYYANERARVWMCWRACLQMCVRACQYASRRAHIHSRAHAQVYVHSRDAADADVFIVPRTAGDDSDVTAVD